MKVSLSERPAKVLHFDIENKPLAYGGSDWTTAEITAIAASWSDRKKIHTWLLGEVDSIEMLIGFSKLYREADVVTGHYIRGHDLPLINGALMEFDLPLLTAKMTSDTCQDLIKRSGISKSQENMSDMFGLKVPKFHMNNNMWRESNRFTKKGLGYTRKRVETDILQHKELRRMLIENDLLKTNKLWTP